MSEGVRLIAAERQRQIEEEHWSPGHDDSHRQDQLTWAATCYAAPTQVYRQTRGGPTDRDLHLLDPWPWGSKWDKRQLASGDWNSRAVTREVLVARKQRIRDLEKAGALIAAEIDRLLRLDPRCPEASDADRCAKLVGHDGGHDALAGPFGPAGDLWGTA